MKQNKSMKSDFMFYSLRFKMLPEQEREITRYPCTVVCPELGRDYCYLLSSVITPSGIVIQKEH